ncbi:hypothetical protein DS2_07488 [Catenovulum agarivorans DS-2]|uniref:Solute-binding protein family 3/N-terminal domain-containing protein n=1 Tax=Catenovulum agarivorans DS-2 TaxID=1328313 RepID=W7QNW0_9ALTE|nr:hypothetical protein [Catenovulum agarivorans]EWH10657.1 hypothetical protein DS2_07488 [Catenovulum agarivorans DS-2]
MSAVSVVYIPQPRSHLDIGHHYHVSLLEKALEHGSNGRTIPRIVTSLHMPEARAYHELIKGEKIDVYWFGTDGKKEQALHPIKIPTSRGLIGYRTFIIHKDSVVQFEQVENLAQLRNYTACQGAHWPDVHILKSAQLPVVTNTMYENIFKRVHAKRCDYFPRPYHDGYNEVRVRQLQYPDLYHYQKIILHYPFAVYFFTAKHNKELAQWIEDGLEKMIDNGALIKHMQNHLLTGHIFPLSVEPGTRHILIDNPIMSADTDWTNTRYWMQPSEFGFAR